MVVLVTLLCLLTYALGYRFYSGFLARRVFELDDRRLTPAVEQEDGVDYVPTRPTVLFGHHFASITGLSPMLGPAVAVIWGWLPALLWVVLGALLIGCVHDFGSLVVSIRARGQSIGKVAEGVIGPRAKVLFLLLIFFGIALAMGVFVYVIAVLFTIGADWLPRDPLADPASFPGAVFPSATLMLLALAMGHLTYRRGWRIGPVTATGFILTLIAVWITFRTPLLGLDPTLWPGRESWTMLLLAYAFAASVLPVWSLLQSRDFLNSLLLYMGLGLAYAGILVARPEFSAPAFRPEPPGAPSFLPFVFIVIACGAASGFHSLVSSGTTAKQLARESHARPIGYGGMIGESSLGLLAVIAATAGFIDRDGISAAQLWRQSYHDWASMQSLGEQVGVFITGSARFIEALGIDFRLAAGLVSVVVVSFALTTLDSATRLLRFNIAEMAETLGWSWLANRFVASVGAVAAIAFFAFYRMDGRPAGLALWQLFGTVNQLLAGLALLVVTLYLAWRRRRAWITGVPALFMMAATLVAMLGNLRRFLGQWHEGGSTLFVVGSILLVLAVWLLIEGAACIRRVYNSPAVTSWEVFSQ